MTTFTGTRAWTQLTAGHTRNPTSRASRAEAGSAVPEGGYEGNGTNGTARYFEDPLGTQIGLEDSLRQARPFLSETCHENDGLECPGGEADVGADL